MKRKINLAEVSEKSALYKVRTHSTKNQSDFNEKSHLVRISKEEKEKLILSLAGNVEWEGKLATKRTSRISSPCL